MEYRRLLIVLAKALWLFVILVIAIQALMSYRVILSKWERVEVPGVIEYPATVMLSYEVEEGFLVLHLKIFFPRGVKADKYRMELRLQDSKGRPAFMASYESIAFQGEYIEKSFRVSLAQLNVFEEYELIVYIHYSKESVMIKRFKVKLLHS